MLEISLIIFFLIFLLLVYRQYNPLSPIDAVGEEKSKDQITYYLSGKGKTVVLFPSLGRTPSDFNDLVSFLNSKGYQTVAIAPRGFKNLSGTDKKDITLFDYAEDIRAVLEHEGVLKEGVCLVGHAFGNRVVRAFSTKYPDSVQKIVLLASGTKSSSETNQKIRKEFIKVFWFFMPQFWRKEKIRNVFFSKKSLVPESWVRGWSSKISKPQALAVDNTPREEWEVGGVAPILAFQGIDDALNPEKVSSAILNAKVADRLVTVAVPDAGYALLPENPDLIFRWIFEFFDD